MERRILRRRPDSTVRRGSIACGLVVLATVVGWLGLAGPAEAATNLSLSLSPPSIVADGSSKSTATATATNPGPLTETVTFSSTPTGVHFSASSCTISPGLTGACSTDITSTVAGQFSISAADGTASDNKPLTALAPSTTSLSPTNTTPVTNEVVWLAANVSSSGSIAGTITFYNGPTPISGCANKPVSSGAAIWCPATFAVSTPQLTAAFTPGAGSGAASSTSSPPVGLTVSPDTTATSLRVSGPVGLGGSATYTATVASGHPGPFVPSGSVKFFDGLQPIPSCLSQPLASGSASCTVSYQTAGSHSITASYSGDANFSGSSSPAQPLSVLPIPGSTTSLVAATDHPATNEDVPLVATVTSIVTPVGTITFKNGGNPVGGCTNKSVTTSGAPIICHASFAASTARLTAVFTPGPGANVVGSTSPTASLTVGQDSSAVALDVSNPTVDVGTSATYRATVTPNHAGFFQPIGSVEFFDGGQPIASCLSQPLRSGGGFNSATCTVGYRKAGTHSITARYSGDGNFTSASSSPQQVSVRTLSFAVLGTVTSTMQWTFFHTPAYTKILSLIMNGAPVGATVVVKCHGQGCPFAKQSTVITKPKPCKRKGKHKCPVQHPGTIDLMTRFRNHRLHPGAQITVEIARPHWIGKYYIFAMRSRQAPRIQIGCLAAGSTRPGANC